MDEEAVFEAWLRARLPVLLRVATALCGSPQQAEDLVQDVAVKAHARWARIQTLEHPDAYVRRMLVNEYLSWRRRLANRSRRGVLDQPSSTDSGTAFDQRCADRAELLAEITKLPPRQRAVVVLRYLEDLDIEETAASLGCAPSTVRAHTARALATLRIALVVPSPQPLRVSYPLSEPAKDRHAH